MLYELTAFLIAYSNIGSFTKELIFEQNMIKKNMDLSYYAGIAVILLEKDYFIFMKERRLLTYLKKNQ